MKNIAIQLTNISKQYTIHHEKPTLVEKFYKSAGWRSEEKFWALKNINLTIKKGERVGIIGPNGSGKTTLLKIISGISSPSCGSVKTYGKIVSLIDLEAGFHPDLSGYQNIYINSLLLGLSRKNIDKILTSVINFADIKQFIDAPLYTYSSGMKLRLGFAILAYIDSDILILDESLSVGDIDFNKKISEKIKQFFEAERTILMVSHSLDFINKFCKRVIEIEHGIIKRDRHSL
jgi:ABC-type polysaccharide/polyol phosphate transport system ATPase subunit